MSRLLAAIAFLTRVPIRRPFTTEDVGRAAVFFPLVGARIGAAQLGLWKLLDATLPPLLLAVLVVSFSAWATRGLHLDGLADFFDGLGGGRTREDVLRIMRDSRIGAFGAIALVLVLFTKVAAIEGAALVLWQALVLAPVFSRWSVVLLGFMLPYARESAAPSSHFGKGELFGATVMLAAACFLAPRLAATMGVSVLVVSLIVGAIARRCIGGVTGDVMGANIEIAEAAALLVAS